MDKDLQLVGFRIGRETFALPIHTVREIIRVPEITCVPDGPEYVEGVINLRGRIIPTPRNIPSRNIYRDNGFSEREDGLWEFTRAAAG